MPDDIARITAAIARLQAESSDFDLNPHVVVPPRNLRPAAVLVAIVAQAGGAQVVLTKRASHLAHHPGQIAFPGGKVESMDTGPKATALREAREEIGLDPALVQVLGTLPAHETVTSFRMVPVVGVLAALPPFTPDRDEVDEVFTVPFAHVCDLAHFRIESRHWQGQQRFFYTVPYGPYYIWGATARVLYALAKGMAA